MIAGCRRESPVTNVREAALGGWARSVAFQVGALILAGCIQTGIPPIGGTPAQRLGEAEALYADARDLYFQVYVTDATGTGRSDRGVELGQLRSAYAALRERALERLDALDSARYGGEDRRAIALMRANLMERGEGTPPPPGEPCRYDVTALAGAGQDALAAAIYRCYGERARVVETPDDTVDRLTVLSRLGTEPSSERRRALFLSLRPVWESVNGTNGPSSPWRTLVGLSAAAWRRDGSPIDRAASSLGLDPARTESTLVSMLDAWRSRTPSTKLEPWDWYYEVGTAGRRLASRIPLGELTEINERYFSSFGASPRALLVRYDLEARPGKTPVAFTQFGGLSRRTGDGPAGANPWVFATYREGGLGNLVELLHETGHAIHIAAIETRPAFADWPDSDPLTEGLADVPALEAYEPAWQQKYLGDSASTTASLREKYGGVMMDVAWALFELRMHADPSRDPNVVWADITSQYLGIVAHPEWSWWAMRGQLIDSPGYMMNYALGAMIAADVRARVQAQRGAFTTADSRTYDWLCQRLYRYGQERSSQAVLEGFLGRPLSAAALITDLERR